MLRKLILILSWGGVAWLAASSIAFAQFDGGLGSRPHASNTNLVRGWRQIAQYTTVTGDTTYTFQLPGRGFTDLELVVMGRGTTAAANRSYSLTVNGSSAAIYSAQRIYAVTTTIAADQTLGNTKWGDGNVAGASAPAGMAGYTRIRIYNYANPTFYKIGEYVQRTGSTTTDQAYYMVGNIQFDTTAPITSLTVTIDANAWAAGSIFTLNALN